MSDFLQDGDVVLPTNFVTRAELRAWVFGCQPADGTATGAMEALSSTGFLQLTSATAGAKTMAAVGAISGITTPAALNQAMQDVEVVTASNFVSDPAIRNTKLTHTAAATGTLASGTYVGQEKHVLFTGAGTGYQVTLTYTGDGGATTATFGEIVSGQIARELHIKWLGSWWGFINNVQIS